MTLADTPEDGELVRKVLAGDREAFRGLVVRYQKRVFHAAYRIVRDTEEAEDLAQETFLKVYANLGKYNSRWAFSTWILTIANRTALNAVRKKNKGSAVSFEDLPPGVGEQDRSAQNPRDKAARSQWFSRLRREVDSLGEKMRIAFGLRYEDDLSISEIARVTRSTQTAVKVTLHRARKILKKKLSEFTDPA